MLLHACRHAALSLQLETSCGLLLTNAAVVVPQTAVCLQDTAKFCSEVLTAPEIVEFVNHNFVSWGGDIRYSDPYLVCVFAHMMHVSGIQVLQRSTKACEKMTHDKQSPPDVHTQPAVYLCA